MTEYRYYIPRERLLKESYRTAKCLNTSSLVWERQIKDVMSEALFDSIYFLGPKGLPVISYAYVVYASRSQKRRADRLLRESGLGSFVSEDPLNLGSHVSLFARAHSDWVAEIPTQGGA